MFAYVTELTINYKGWNKKANRQNAAEILRKNFFHLTLLPLSQFYIKIRPHLKKMCDNLVD